MKPLNAPCGTCGAPLDLDGSTRTPACAFCGARTVLSDEVWRAVRPMAEAAPAAVAAGNLRTVRVVLAVIGTALLLVAAAVLVVSKIRANAGRGIGDVNGPCNGMKWACSKDKKAQLRCDDERLVVALSCKGPKGCRVAGDGTEVSCDYTFADPGDPCNVEDDACSTDRLAIVHCDKATFSVSATCKGPGGCSITPHDHDATLACDDHVADPDDLCKSEDSACSPDHRAMLRCKLGRFVMLGTCKGPGACSISKNPSAETTTITCDSNVAELGDLCQGGFACSSDATTLLRCEGARFVAAERCAGGCATSSDTVHCRSKRGY